MPVATRSTRDGAAETSTPPPATASDESVLDDPAGGGDSTSAVPRPVFSPTRGVESTLALPALTQLKTRTGIVQLHQFNGEDLADFITSMLDPSDITTPIRDLLGDVRGQVQMDITSSIAEITADATIKKRIKDMSDSSMRSIATFLPAIFRELLKKAVREAAPIIPAHFNLVMPGSKEDLITAPARTAISAMLKLLPHYTELKLIKDRIEKNKDSSSKIQDKLERLDILLTDDDADSIFAFDATGYWDDKEAEKLYRNVMPKLTAFAKKYSIKEEIEVIECFNEWHLLADDFEDQDAESCAAKFKAIHAEKRRQQYTKQLTSLIAKRKEMTASMKSVRYGAWGPWAQQVLQELLTHAAQTSQGVGVRSVYGWLVPHLAKAVKQLIGVAWMKGIATSIHRAASRVLVDGLRWRHAWTSWLWTSCSALSVSRPPSSPLEVREGQRGALRPRQLASGLALVVVRNPRAPCVRVLRCHHLLLVRRRRARLVPLNHLRVEIVVPQAPPHSPRRECAPKCVFN